MYNIYDVLINKSYGFIYEKEKRDGRMKRRTWRVKTHEYVYVYMKEKRKLEQKGKKDREKKREKERKTKGRNIRLKMPESYIVCSANR